MDKYEPGFGKTNFQRVHTVRPHKSQTLLAEANNSQMGSFEI